MENPVIIKRYVIDQADGEYRARPVSQHGPAVWMLHEPIVIGDTRDEVREEMSICYPGVIEVDWLTDPERPSQ